MHGQLIFALGYERTSGMIKLCVAEFPIGGENLSPTIRSSSWLRISSKPFNWRVLPTHTANSPFLAVILLQLRMDGDNAHVVVTVSHDGTAKVIPDLKRRAWWKGFPFSRGGCVKTFPSPPHSAPSPPLGFGFLGLAVVLPVLVVLWSSFFLY